LTRQTGFHPDATEELLAAMDWYEERRPGLGAELYQEILQKLESGFPVPALEVDPEGTELHRLLVKRFPYTLYVEMRVNGDVFVLAVAHQSRRPGYWRRRRPRRGGRR
jgi:hypothetical protein